MSVLTNDDISGLSWMPSLPNGWRTARLKNVCTLNYGDSLADEKRIEGEVPVFGSNGVVGKHNRAITSAPCIIVGRKGSYGKVNYATEPCFPIDTTYWIDAHSTTEDLRWLSYILPLLELDTNSQDSAVPGLSREVAYEKRLPIPPLPEQHRIAVYLDEQMGKLDALMNMRRRQMALLREQQASLIQRVVTRGLNPNAPMKNSGLPWMGEIPAQWEVKKLKSLCSTTKGFAFKSELFVSEGAPVVRASEIKNFTVETCGTFIRPDMALAYRQVALCSGDILISTVGSKAEILDSAVGQVGVIPPELDGALLNQNTVRLELACPNEVLKGFLFYILRTDAFRKHLDRHAHGTANQASLSLVDILSFPAPLPPLTEQLSIIKFIDYQCVKIETALSAYARQLTLLAEYRAALIHECVTGQGRIGEDLVPETL